MAGNQGGKRKGAGRKEMPPSERMVTRRTAISLPPEYDKILDAFLNGKKYSQYLREKTIEDLDQYKAQQKKE